MIMVGVRYVMYVHLLQGSVLGVLAERLRRRRERIDMLSGVRLPVPGRNGSSWKCLRAGTDGARLLGIIG